MVVVCLSRFDQNLCLAVAKVSDLLSACLSSVYLPGRFTLAVNMQTFLSIKNKKISFVCYAWMEDRHQSKVLCPIKLSNEFKDAK